MTGVVNGLKYTVPKPVAVYTVGQRYYPIGDSSSSVWQKIAKVFRLEDAEVRRINIEVVVRGKGLGG